MAKKYFAFISYKREDEDWAKWFQNELENYHLPSTLNGRKDLPREFRPVFRDIDELKAGNLPRQIYSALTDSANLIVICSSRLGDDGQARWVNKEISDFIEIRRQENGEDDALSRIFPFIIDGTPHSKDITKECFPKILRELPDHKEIVGGNVNEDGGRERAFVKVLAGMLPVSFDELWNKYERDKIEKERREREQRDRLLLMQSRVVAEKAMNLISGDNSYMARRLLSEFLPENTAQPDRPWSPEVEQALYQASVSDNARLTGHTAPVLATSCSRDGKYVASASEDHTVRIWEVHTGKCVRILRDHTDIVSSVCFSPDGRHLFSGSYDRDVRMWDVATWECKAVFRNGSIVTSVNLRPGGRTFIAASADMINLWNIARRSITRTLAIEGTDENIRAVCYSPDGKYIAAITAFGPNDIFIWNSRTGKLCKTLITTERIKTLCFSPDGRYLAAGPFGSRRIDLWDYTHDFGIWKSLESDMSYTPYSLAFSADSSLLACGTDWRAEIWNVRDGRRILREDIDVGCVQSVCFNNDASRLFFGMSTWKVGILDISARPQPESVDMKHGSLSAVCVSGDGRYIVTSSSISRHYESTPLVIVWDTVRQEKAWEKICEMEVFSVRCTPDSRFLAITDRDFIDIIDISDGRSVRTLRGHLEEFIFSIDISPDGRRLVSAGIDNAIILWDMETGEATARIDCEPYCSMVRFSPDGKHFLSLSFNGELGIRNTDDLSSYRKISGPAGIRKDSVCFSPDGKYVLWGASDYFIRVWDTDRGKCVRELTAPAEKYLTDAIIFSPDGKYMISGGNSSMYSLAVLMFWDLESGVCVNTITLDTHAGLLRAAGFVSGGKKIAALLNNGKTMMVPFVPFQTLVEETRRRFRDQPLTPEERHAYYLDV